MKITDVVAIPLRIPTNLAGIDYEGNFLREPAIVLVEVRTDEGLVGLGDAWAYGVAEATTAMIAHTLRPLLLGEDPTRIMALTRRLFQAMHFNSRSGITAFAISGVELALWDLAGKRAGLPLYALLGGATLAELPAYASLIRYPEEDRRIAQDAERAVAQGYRHVKLHQRSPASVALARKAIGEDVVLTVDVNCQWRTQEAIARAEAMRACDILWLEEPVYPPDDFTALAEVQAAGGVPLASGENLGTAWQFRQLVEAGAATYVQPSVAKVGGVAEFLEVCRLAEAYSLELAPHSPTFGPAFVATLHLMAATGQPRWVEQPFAELAAELFTEPLRPHQGTYALPPGPGLGVTVDPQVIAKYRIDR